MERPGRNLRPLPLTCRAPFCSVALIRTLLLTVVLLLAGAAPASAATKTWDGGAGTEQFNDAANWAPNGVPGADDLVVLDDAADVVRLENGVDRTIDQLAYTAGSLTVVGRTLTIDGGGGDSTIERALAVGAGGTVDLADPPDATTRTILDAGGRFSLSSADARVINRGSLSVLAGAGPDLSTGPGLLDNRSFITQAGGDHQISSDFANTNDGGAAFGVLLIDAGTLTLLGDATSAGRLTIGFASTLTVQGGTLTVAPGSELSGGALALASAMFGATRVTARTARRSRPALVRLAAGELVIDDESGGLNALEQTGGTLRGSGTVGISQLTWTGGAQGGPARPCSPRSPRSPCCRAPSSSPARSGSNATWTGAPPAARSRSPPAGRSRTPRR